MSRDDQGDKKFNKPVRDRLRDVTSDIPSRAGGKVGEGDVLGAAGYIAVEATRTVFQFVPGIQTPGYTVISHGIEETNEEFEIHSFTIAAVSEDVAEFVAQYFSAPSNVNYLTSSVEILSVETTTERRAYDTFEIRTRIEKRPDV